MKITISHNPGESRTVVNHTYKNGGQFDWSRLGPVKVKENSSGKSGRGRGSSSGNPMSANERLNRNGPLDQALDSSEALSQNGGKGGRGRGNGRGSGKPKTRRSANERLVRAPHAPTSASNSRGDDINNNEPMEVETIQPPVRSDTSSPNCICLRPLKMVLCR